MTHNGKSGFAPVVKTEKPILTNSYTSWPAYGQDEIEAVARVLGSGKVNYWTGDEGRQFENEFAEWVGGGYAIALANGTVALDVALKVLGIGPGDEVVVTSRTFLASVSCIVNAGAIPIFADVDANTQNITARTIHEVLTPRTRAIICVHLAGWPCEMDEIVMLAEARGLYVIEDCAQAHGAKYKSRSVGTIGHIGAWSFCQDKIITTGGEGGMLTTNDKAVWARAWSYKDHGKSWDAVYNHQHPPGFRWLHEMFGSNYRITEMQAAIGRIQLKRMPDWHEARKRNAEAILGAARVCPVLRVPDVPSHIEHAWYKCYVFVRPERLKAGWDRDRIVSEINARDVPCFVGSCSEVYLEKAFEGTGWRPATRLPTAKELGETSLMFLVHPTLTEDEITKAAIVIQDVAGAALG